MFLNDFTAIYKKIVFREVLKGLSFWGVEA